MPGAVAEMPNIDLGREIEQQRTRLQQLEELQGQQQKINDQIRLILQPMPYNPKLSGAIKKAQKVQRRQSDKPLSDVVFEAMMKKGPGTQVTIKEAIDLAAAMGHKSNSEQPHTVFRQMFQRDKRFKKHRVRGERQVRFGLSHNH